MSYSDINLYYLYTASRLNISDYRVYEKILSNRNTITNLGEREKGSLYYLVDLLLDCGCTVNDLANFYYSFTIPHIGKEFDLLKINDDAVLNIELKSENVGLERIETQLLCNYKYLKYLSKRMYLYTFVSDSKTFYKLNDNLELVYVKKEELVEVIKSFKSSNVKINDLFKTNDFLVSPNTTPLKFINGQYFLTTQQEYIKNKLLSSLKEKVFKITGEAGTGKTLLLFDIAKELTIMGKVLVINCNKKNEAHDVINNAFNKLKVLSQNEVISNQEEIYYADYILLDEAQRMDKNLWSLLIKYINSFDKRLIFSLDPKQVLTKEEIKADYNHLIDTLQPVKYKLSNRIRINNSIKEFTYRLFDLSLEKYKLNLEDVKLHYASNLEELKMYFEIYKNDYTYISIPNTKYQINDIKHLQISEVVGKDYDNVMMVIDENYYYNKMKLASYDSLSNDYLYLKILYQGLSRTREKLVLIVYKNKKLFKKILEVKK